MVAEGKLADTELQLDVDELILDYVLYEAIKALLEERMMQRQARGPTELIRLSAETPLALVNCEQIRALPS